MINCKAREYRKVETRDHETLRMRHGLFNEPANRAIRNSLLNPARVAEKAIRDIRGNVRNLDDYHSSDSSPETRGKRNK